MLRRLNIHEKISLFWFLISLPVIGILFEESFSKTTLYTMIAFVCSLAVTIIVAPIFLRFELIKRNFNWMDALTTEQKEVILNFKIVKYHKIPRTPDCLSRIKPYIFRIWACGIILGLVGGTPYMIDSNLSILCGALSFYLLGVLLVVVATVAVFQGNFSREM
jgi:hypothetical protein